MLAFHLPMINGVTDETIQNSYSSNAVSGDATTLKAGLVSDVNSPFGKYVSYTGSGSITFSFTPELNKTTKLSVAFWVRKPGTEIPSNWGAWTFAVGTTNGSSTADFRLELEKNTTDWFGLYDNGHFTGNSPAFHTEMYLGVWYHFVVSVDADTGDWEYWTYNLNTGEEIHNTGNDSDHTYCYFTNLVRLNKSLVNEMDYADLRVYTHRVSQYEVEQMRKRLVCQYCFDEV